MTRPPVDTHTCLPMLLSRTRAVLFDFDGPICDLFVGRSTRPIAQEIKAMARKKWRVLDPVVEACEDSHSLLRLLGDMLDRSGADTLDPETLKTADELVTRYEEDAVASAVPAPEIHTLLDTLLGLGKRLVIVTNNAEKPVQKFLGIHGMSHKFEAVFGRDPYEPHRMKPDPSSVQRALRHLGDMSPDGAVMVGDQLTDLQAATSAGVRFLGYSALSSRSCHEVTSSSL
ncbi:HAD-IA family hydrolase [Streptomyces europaeiscabiei]|uniref:HAD-IA family hydrolase n=1 Tax=Streptomyces europaeiscabiei TaxID=146819 RepID=A0AAJ2PUA6_9ACTN|nr:HAD-IA family hydrolase [Streptomyces europaeiscabiei]MDX3133418.1 HAD-IA family hydrolase [Streptomyces europaeiscabiei]